MQTKNLNKQFQTLPIQPKALKLEHKHYVVLLILFAAAAIYILMSSSGGLSGTGLDYELMVNDNNKAIVLLKEPITQDLHPAKLNTIADSLYAERTPSAIDPVRDQYHVWFYYRPDWKGHIYYAGKVWSYDVRTHQMEAYELDVTGITGNNEEDDRSSRRRHDEAR
jgi:hypothetical protein